MAIRFVFLVAGPVLAGAVTSNRAEVAADGQTKHSDVPISRSSKRVLNIGPAGDITEEARATLALDPAADLLQDIGVDVLASAERVKTNKTFISKAKSSSSQVAEVLEILLHLKLAREASMLAVDAVAASLSKSGNFADSEKLKLWGNAWLTVLGMSRCAGDFVVNYLGRRAYHQADGPLIRSLNHLLQSLPDAQGNYTESQALVARNHALQSCRHAVVLFHKDGALHHMAHGLLEILLKDSTAKHFVDAFKQHPPLRLALGYLVGPRPDEKSADATSTWSKARVNGAGFLATILAMISVTATVIALLLVWFIRNVMKVWIGLHSKLMDSGFERTVLVPKRCHFYS